MFEEAEEIAKDIYIHHFDDDINYPDVLKAITVGVQKGAEYGYNKANEWHFSSKGELPETSGKYLVFTGGEPFMLDYDTETKDFGYWCLDVGDNFGVRDTIFETITELDEDKVIAWKEIVLPKEIENA